MLNASLDDGEGSPIAIGTASEQVEDQAKRDEVHYDGDQLFDSMYVQSKKPQHHRPRPMPEVRRVATSRHFYNGLHPSPNSYFHHHEEDHNADRGRSSSSPQDDDHPSLRLVNDPTPLQIQYVVSNLWNPNTTSSSATLVQHDSNINNNNEKKRPQFQSKQQGDRGGHRRDPITAAARGLPPLGGETALRPPATSSSGVTNLRSAASPSPTMPASLANALIHGPFTVGAEQPREEEAAARKVDFGDGEEEEGPAVVLRRVKITTDSGASADEKGGKAVGPNFESKVGEKKQGPSQMEKPAAAAAAGNLAAAADNAASVPLEGANSEIAPGVSAAVEKQRDPSGIVVGDGTDSNNNIKHQEEKDGGGKNGGGGGVASPLPSFMTSLERQRAKELDDAAASAARDVQVLEELLTSPEQSNKKDLSDRTPRQDRRLVVPTPTIVSANRAGNSIDVDGDGAAVAPSPPSVSPIPVDTSSRRETSTTPPSSTSQEVVSRPEVGHSTTKTTGVTHHHQKGLELLEAEESRGRVAVTQDHESSEWDSLQNFHHQVQQQEWRLRISIRTQDDFWAERMWRKNISYDREKERLVLRDNFIRQRSCLALVEQNESQETRERQLILECQAEVWQQMTNLIAELREEILLRKKQQADTIEQGKATEENFREKLQAAKDSKQGTIDDLEKQLSEKNSEIKTLKEDLRGVDLTPPRNERKPQSAVHAEKPLPSAVQAPPAPSPCATTTGGVRTSSATSTPPPKPQEPWRSVTTTPLPGSCSSSGTSALVPLGGGCRGGDNPTFSASSPNPLLFTKVAEGFTGTTATTTTAPPNSVTCAPGRTPVPQSSALTPMLTTTSKRRRQSAQPEHTVSTHLFFTPPHPIKPPTFLTPPSPQNGKSVSILTEEEQAAHHQIREFLRKQRENFEDQSDISRGHVIIEEEQRRSHLESVQGTECAYLTTLNTI